ncbi:MAG TPA: efflux transporter outer membrane subunit [Candidatus Binatia bacterium]|jgi:NodT family efflux transporter outer membrane factor (OMF) lipoprotein
MKCRFAGKGAVLVFACVAACGCIGPYEKRPVIETAPGWVEADGYAGTAPEDSQWWQSFSDPALAQMVERARTASPRMREAVARVREARALRAAQIGEFFPQGNVDAGWSKSRISQHGFFEALAGAVATGPAGAVFQPIGLYQLGFDAQWEIDVFGHVRRSVEAAGAEVGAAQASAADVERTLMAETAREVIELRSFDERLRIAAENSESQRETLDVLRDRRRVGIASDADVARGDAQLSATESVAAMLRGQRAASLHRLETLVAASPGTLDADLAGKSEIPQPSVLPAAGLPSELLLHRPDIAHAERELAAATARAGVARTELLPRFSLTGSFGVQSQNSSDLLTSESRFWSVGPGVQWPIFSAGRLCNAVKAADARTEAAAARYESAVRQAIAEVETAMAGLVHEREREQALRRAADDEALAAAASRDLYKSGLTDLLHVLDAERSRYIAEDELAGSRTRVAEQAIALYKALGAGWSADAAPGNSASGSGTGGAGPGAVAAGASNAGTKGAGENTSGKGTNAPAGVAATPAAPSPGA